MKNYLQKNIIFFFKNFSETQIFFLILYSNKFCPLHKKGNKF